MNTGTVDSSPENLSEQLYGNLLKRLLAGDRFLLTTHRGPDPDGIGAELALEYLLREKGKDVIIYNHDPVPLRYRFLDPERRVKDVGMNIPREDLSGRTVVFLDNSDLQRSGDAGSYVSADRSNLVVIDHHDGLPSDFRSVFLDANAGSTSEMVYHLLVKAGVELNSSIAASIYAGMVVDTGHFRYQKTKPETHRVAARLLELGVNPADMGDRLFSSWSVSRLWGRRLLYDSMRVDEERRIAWFSIRRRQLDEVSASFDDLDGILNELIEADEILAAVLFTEREADRTKASLRSKGEVDLLPAVKRYGGGGHRNACGATLSLGLERAVEEFVPIVAGCVRPYL